MKKILCAFLVFISVLLCSCSVAGYKSTDFFAMNTYASVIADTSNESILTELRSEVLRIEKLLSATYENSDVYRLFEDKTVSAETLGLLEKAHDISINTEGCFDYTLGALIKLWSVNGEDPHVPDRDEIESALLNCGYENISFQDGQITSETEDLSVDLGAIAKGYAGQRLCDILREKGVENACISLGGNISVIGSSSKNRKNGIYGWNVAITDPFDTSAVIGTITVSNKTVSVSGSYERYFEENGVRYHHIFDRTTGFPSNSDIVSVAVICDDGTYADALSTALFVMGYDKAMEFYHKGIYPFEAVFCKSDGSVFVTDGIVDSFSPLQSKNVTFPQY